MRPIRNSAKAAIINSGRILVIVRSDDNGPWYVLPGGGQHAGETLVEAVRRECLEEVGVVPTVGDLLWIREYIGAHHEFAAQDAEVHQTEFIFRCVVPDDYVPAHGHEPDVGQQDVRWLPVARLLSHRLYPQSLRPHLMAMEAAQWPDRAPVYLGDVN